MSTSAFVEQLYLTFFGRPADDAGRAYWSAAIEAGALSAAEVSRHFLESAEFADAVAPVARLYYSAFDRIPDAGGLAFWLKSAQAGASLDAIADAFVMSPEFAQVYGAARNPDFIDLIYQNALGRAADAGGKAYWLEQLAQGKASRADVLTAIAASSEMADASSAAITVIAQYHGITGSAPTQQQIDSALLLEEPLTLINQLFASSRYTGAPVPHPFVTGHVAMSHGGGGTIIDSTNRAPVIDAGATGPTDGVTPTIVLAFSQDVFAAGGMIYITDGAAQTVIDRVTKLPVVRIVGASDTRAIDVNDIDHVTFNGNQVTITVSSALKSGVTYSVLIGKGVLVGANDMPFGGIADSTTLNFTPVGDATPPAVVAFSLDRETFNAGHTATMTIEFSEAVQSLDASNFETPNGTLTDFASADGGRTWTALFTPAMSRDDAINVITLLKGSVRDLAGNVIAEAAGSSNYVIDTIVTPVVDSKLEFKDTGISSTDRLTNDPTQTLSGKFVGAPSGTTLKVVLNGVGHDVLPNADSTWTFSGGEFTEGLNTVMAYFTNPAGNTSAKRSLSFTLDTTAPELMGLPALVDPAAALVISFGEPVYWTNPEAEIVLESANGSVTFGLADLDFSADRTTVTVGGANQLAPGTNYTVMLPQALTDAAGNPVAATLSFVTGGAAPDVVAEALAALDLLPQYDSGTSSTDNITSGLPLAFSGAAEALATVRLYDVATSALLATQAAGADGKWTIGLDSLPEGSLRLAVTQTDVAGNPSAMSPELALVVDKTAPAAPSALNLLAASASVATPAISGAAAAPGDVVKLYADGVEVGASAVGADGKWQVAPSNGLTEGAHGMTVKFIDTAGNVSAASAALAVTIDTTAPAAASALDLVAASDSGSSWVDNITSLATPGFSGPAATPGDVVKLYADGAEVGSSEVAADGNWQVAPANRLTDGAHSMTVKFIDTAGNVSAASAGLGVTIDTIAPGAPSVLDLLASSDSGSSPTDNITRTTLPTFGGSAGIAGQTVKLYADGVEVGSATVGTAGAWQVTAAMELVEGGRSMTAKFVDAAGNASAASPALGITIDTTAPTIVDTTPDEGGYTSGEVKLIFSEHISFIGGTIKVAGLFSDLSSLITVADNAAWWIGASPANANRSVLTVAPDIGLGQYSLTLEANSIVDVAGNAYAEIIGAPVLTFQLTLL